MTRLAKHRPVVFIEEPILAEHLDAPEWQKSEPAQNVTVLVPNLPSALYSSDFESIHVKRLLQDFASSGVFAAPTVWLYTPSAVDLVPLLRPNLIVYDCMDELSAFLHAPPKLRDQEKRLLAMTDLVFTGGRSLFRAKRDSHPEVYCFPSSVDASHFRGDGDVLEPLDQMNIPFPRLGFFGVLDERLDAGLLEEAARQRPEWQIVMVGPVAKIDPASLPKLPNIHYLGGKQYADLPSYIQSWDVCLMPFALNDATKFISPTKVLEYMAAGKPIVSTPITDVVEPYSDIVRIGEGADEFIRCCDEALGADAENWGLRKAKSDKLVAATSWDQTARAMLTLMEAKTPSDSPDILVGKKVLVAGAGPTGLSAAYHLGEQAILVEREDRVGGWCRSTQVDGFTFDFAGHIMFSSEPYVHQMYKLLLGENVHWQDREAWIHSYGVYTRYPFQGSLYGLPAHVIQECIVGAIESRYGSIKPPAPAGKPADAAASQMEKNGTCVKDCCADGLIEAETPVSADALEPVSARAPQNFEEFIYKVWGSGIAKHFAIPYNRKLWAVPLHQMETSWLGGRVPMPNLEEMIEGSLRPSTKPMGPNARFGYPLRGGFQALMDGFMPHLKGRLLTKTSIVGIHPLDRIALLSDGSSVHYDHLISTMPLPALVRLMGDAAPTAIHAASAKLINVSVRCVNIGVGRGNLTEKHWIYYPGDTVFHRVFVQGNASPYCNPAGGFGLTCEITYSPDKPLPCDGDELTALAIRDCIRVGLFNAEDPILTSLQIDMPYAYVVYDHHRQEAVKTIRDWMATHHISLAGRYSEWEYYNSDHAFIAGRNAAEAAMQDLSTKASRQSVIASVDAGNEISI